MSWSTLSKRELWMRSRYVSLIKRIEAVNGALFSDDPLGWNRKSGTATKASNASLAIVRLWLCVDRVGMPS